MSCILFVDDEENTKKLNIDDLYEKNQKRDLKQLSIFNKILNRVHKRITLTSRNKQNEKHIWFTIPEYIFGEPVYDNAECIAYLVSSLETNGFFIKYVHPNTMFVSWEKWVPSYVRSTLKKKMGIVVNEKGEIISKDDTESPDDINSKILNENRATNGPQKEQKQYTPIGSYKPTGNLVYNPEIFEKLEKRMA